MLPGARIRRGPARMVQPLRKHWLEARRTSPGRLEGRGAACGAGRPNGYGCARPAAEHAAGKRLEARGIAAGPAFKSKAKCFSGWPEALYLPALPSGRQGGCQCQRKCHPWTAGSRGFENVKTWERPALRLTPTPPSPLPLSASVCRSPRSKAKLGLAIGVHVGTAGGRRCSGMASLLASRRFPRCQVAC